MAKKLLLEMSYLVHYLPLTLTKKDKTIVYATFFFYKRGTHTLYICLYYTSTKKFEDVFFIPRL